MIRPPSHTPSRSIWARRSRNQRAVFSFAAWVTYDQVLLMRLYPEQAAELRFPQIKRGKLYVYCTRDGLMEYGVSA